jgi:hypothetical protein
LVFLAVFSRYCIDQIKKDEMASSCGTHAGRWPFKEAARKTWTRWDYNTTYYSGSRRNRTWGCGLDSSGPHGLFGDSCTFTFLYLQNRCTLTLCVCVCKSKPIAVCNLLTVVALRRCELPDVFCRSLCAVLEPNSPEWRTHCSRMANFSLLFLREPG